MQKCFVFGKGLNWSTNSPGTDFVSTSVLNNGSQVDKCPLGLTNTTPSGGGFLYAYFPTPLIIVIIWNIPMAIQVRRKYQALLLRTGNTANPTIQKKMIISDKYRFVFIHIPKCAGMTIQNQLQSFDDTNGAHMGKVANHQAGAS